METFKTKSITLRNRVAVLQYESKWRKVYVLWATMTATGFDVLNGWPQMYTKEREEFEQLLSNVREYCSAHNLRLWSY